MSRVIPGRGKTAVWLDAVAGAERRGDLVLQARPAESEAALAYSALTDLIGPIFDEVAGTLPLPQASALGTVLLRTESSRPTAVISVLGHLAPEPQPACESSRARMATVPLANYLRARSGQSHHQIKLSGHHVRG